MPTKVRFIIGDDDDVMGARGNGVLTARTQIVLLGGVRLNRSDRHPEKIAHNTRPIAAPMARTIMSKSTLERSWSRNGLKPMVKR